MENLPRIFANCPAGCKWETVHKAEFVNSASHIWQYPNENGSHTLEIGKEYKIFASQSNEAFNVRLVIAHQPIEPHDAPVEVRPIDTPCNDIFANSFTFKLLAVTGDYAIYELSGVRYMIAGFSGKFIGCEVLGATKVLLYNADAFITAQIADMDFAKTLGDIETALDHIIDIQKELADMIVFTYEGLTCRALNGMTWKEWIDNENEGGYEIYYDEAEGIVFDADGLRIINEDTKEFQTPDTVIADGAKYTYYYEAVMS